MFGDNGVLQELVAMSQELGRPEHQYVILGEGNTSARVDGGSFWVKASGYSLAGIEPRGFVRLSFQPLLEALERPALSDDDVSRVLQEATLEPEGLRPSVESFLHAVALAEGEACFVAHTHPTAVNRVLCSIRARELVQGRLFPDEVVSCGCASLYLEYEDPGFALARQFRQGLAAYRQENGVSPKVVLIENHGLIALGSTVREVLATTAMAVKAFEILWGAAVLGGPRYLPEQEVKRINSRLDEHYRRGLLHAR